MFALCGRPCPQSPRRLAGFFGGTSVCLRKTRRHPVGDPSGKHSRSRFARPAMQPQAAAAPQGPRRSRLASCALKECARSAHKRRQESAAFPGPLWSGDGRTTRPAGATTGSRCLFASTRMCWRKARPASTNPQGRKPGGRVTGVRFLLPIFSLRSQREVGRGPRPRKLLAACDCRSPAIRESRTKRAKRAQAAAGRLQSTGSMPCWRR